MFGLTGFPVYRESGYKGFYCTMFIKLIMLTFIQCVTD